MHKMGFVGDNDDAGKIVKVETQILKEEGEHSKKCINSVGKDFGINTDEALEGLLEQLTGKKLADVMKNGSGEKQLIYALFGAAKTCIANAKPTQQYKCGNE